MNAHIILDTISWECIDSKTLVLVEVLYDDASERRLTPNLQKVRWIQILQGEEKPAVGLRHCSSSLSTAVISVSSIFKPVVFHKAGTMVISALFSSCFARTWEGLDTLTCEKPGEQLRLVGLITCSLSVMHGIRRDTAQQRVLDWQHLLEQWAWIRHLFKRMSSVCTSGEGVVIRQKQCGLQSCLV